MAPASTDTVPPSDARAVAAAAAHVAAVVEGSGTSFALGMKILPAERRHAMFAIYAFCREVDDIADDLGAAEDKLERLGAWRAEIDRLYAGQPSRPAALALVGPVQRFGLPRAEFIAMIEGMEMDAREMMRGPNSAQLQAYCRRVAGAVGLLSLPVFGAEGEAARTFALALGEALQLTNILRDVDEDAARGRLYLPSEMLVRHGVLPADDPARALGHPALPRVCQDLAVVARRRFADADAALAQCSRRSLRPALLMMGIYEVILGRLIARGWEPGRRTPIRLSKAEKLWAAIRWGLLRPAVRAA